MFTYLNVILASNCSLVCMRIDDVNSLNFIHEKKLYYKCSKPHKYGRCVISVPALNVGNGLLPLKECKVVYAQILWEIQP